MSYEFDVAISVDGADSAALDAADRIAAWLQSHGLKVFHYRSEDELEDMYGSNLKSRLREIYGRDSRLVAPIFSAQYAAHGYTALEWDVIRERVSADGGARRMIAVATSPIESFVHGSLKDFVYQEYTGNAGAVARTILNRLGVRGYIRAWIEVAALGTALATLLWRFSTLEFVSNAAVNAGAFAIVLALIWVTLFRAIPRLANDWVFRLRAGVSAFGIVYRRRLFDPVALVLALAAFGVAHVIIPNLGDRIEFFRSAWLDDRDRDAAQRFFCDVLSAAERQRALLPVISDRDQTGGGRGRALNLLYLCTDPQTAAEIRPISAQFLNPVACPWLRHDPEQAVNTLVDVDFSVIPSLARADLAGISLVGDDFGAPHDLSQAKLAGTWLNNFNISKTDARWSDFSNSVMTAVTARDVILSGAQLQGATIFGGDFSGADFFGANLTGATFLHVNLSGADFTNAELAGVRFEHSNLSGATFTKPEVKWSQRWGRLSAVEFIHSDLLGADMTSADFGPSAVTFGAHASKQLGGTTCALYSGSSEAATAVDEEAKFAITLALPSARFVGSDLSAAETSRASLGDIKQLQTAPAEPLWTQITVELDTMLDAASITIDRCAN